MLILTKDIHVSLHSRYRNIMSLLAYGTKTTSLYMECKILECQAQHNSTAMTKDEKSHWQKWEYQILAFSFTNQFLHPLKTTKFHLIGLGTKNFLLAL